MFVDTSALIAILFAEPDAATYAEAIFDANSCRISAGSYVELFVVLERQGNASTVQQAEMLLARGNITVEPVTVEHGHVARQAFRDFGKGKHKAGLNFGDCFAYALAKVTGEPLLFKGRDFVRTDIVPAI